MNIREVLEREGVQPAVRELLVKIVEYIEQSEGGEITVNWNDIQGKPSTFPPSTHTHDIADVESLQATLNDIESRLSALEGGGG